MAIYDIYGNIILNETASGSSGTVATQSKLQYSKNVHGVNHRGYNSAPENTLQAYKLSAKNGFKFVETDVRFTSDGVAVLLHEESINKTGRNSDGTTLSETIKIADITYNEALTYDFGIYKSEDYVSTKIPSFEEFILLCKGLDLHPYIELKAGTEAQIQSKIIDVVKAYGMENRVTYIGNTNYLNYVKKYDKHARLGILGNTLGNNITDSAITTAKSLLTGYNEVFFNCWYSFTDNEEVERIKEAGFPLEFFTFTNTEAEILSAVSAVPYLTGWTADSVNIETVLYNNMKE